VQTTVLICIWYYDITLIRRDHVVHWHWGLGCSVSHCSYWWI